MIGDMRFRSTGADEETIQRVRRHLIGPGALLDEPSDVLLAPHDIPVFLSSVRARLPRAYPDSEPAERIHGSGCGLTRATAQASAFGEALERYSAWQRGANDNVRASYRELGQQAVNPEDFALYAEEQYTDPALHFGRFTDTTVLDWVEGWSWTQQRPQYIPTCFVYQEPCAGARQCIFHAVSTGLACSATDEVARLVGLYEVMERDAIMIAWLNGLELPRLRPPADDVVLNEIYRRLAAKRIQATVLDATTADTGLPVRIALVENRDGAPPECAVGMAARSEPLQAHRKALLEACHTMNWLHQLKQQQTESSAAVAAAPLLTFKPKFPWQNRRRVK